MKFLVDNNLSPRIARALDALSEDHEVVHVRDKFDPSTPDVDWLGELGSEGDWVIVSGDLRISRNREELAAWLESGCTAFFLEKGWAHLEFWDKAARLVHWWPKIIAQAETVGSQVGYMVPVRGAKLRILTTK